MDQYPLHMDRPWQNRIDCSDTDGKVRRGKNTVDLPGYKAMRERKIQEDENQQDQSQQ
jgi:hypothetical protein